MRFKKHQNILKDFFENVQTVDIGGEVMSSPQRGTNRCCSVGTVLLICGV